MHTHQETVDILWAADQFGEGSQLLCQCQQHLVLIVDGLRQERDQLVPCPLHTQSQCDSGQLLDRVQPQLKQAGIQCKLLCIRGGGVAAITVSCPTTTGPAPAPSTLSHPCASCFGLEFGILYCIHPIPLASASLALVTDIELPLPQ